MPIRDLDPDNDYAYDITNQTDAVGDDDSTDMVALVNFQATVTQAGGGAYRAVVSFNDVILLDAIFLNAPAALAVVQNNLAAIVSSTRS
jgi:hypothetical protein